MRCRAAGISTSSSISSARFIAPRAIDAEVHRDGLGDLVADGEHRIEARHRLLEDHRDVAAAQLAQRLRRQPREIDDVAVARAKQDLAADDAPGRIRQSGP